MREPSYDLTLLGQTAVMICPDHRHMSFKGGIDHDTPQRHITQIGCRWVDEYMAAQQLTITDDSLIETLDKARAWREHPAKARQEPTP